MVHDAFCSPALPLATPPERNRESVGDITRGAERQITREQTGQRERERWRKKIHSLSGRPRQNQNANDSETESRRTNRRGTIYQHAPVRRLDHWLRP